MLRKNLPTKTCTTKNDTGKRYKNSGFGRPLATTSSCGTVFLKKTVFQLSRLGSELAMNVFPGHNHKTTSKPEYTTKQVFQGDPKIKLDDENCVQTMRSKKRSAGECKNSSPMLCNIGGPIFNARTVRGQKWLNVVVHLNSCLSVNWLSIFFSVLLLLSPKTISPLVFSQKSILK